MRKSFILFAAFIALALLSGEPTKAAITPVLVASRGMDAAKTAVRLVDCEKLIEAYEARIRHSSVENNAIFDQHCNLLFESVGTADNGGEVGVPDENWSGDILTHNHMREITLGTDDVLMVAARYNLYQIRATLPSGKVCMVTATPDHPIVYHDWDWSLIPVGDDTVALNRGYTLALDKYAREIGVGYGCIW